MNLLITTARSLGCVSTISDSTKFASKLNRPRTTISALVFDPLLPSAFSRARSRRKCDQSSTLASSASPIECDVMSSSKLMLMNSSRSIIDRCCISVSAR